MNKTSAAITVIVSRIRIQIALLEKDGFIVPRIALQDGQ